MNYFMDLFAYKDILVDSLMREVSNKENGIMDLTLYPVSVPF